MLKLWPRRLLSTQTVSSTLPALCAALALTVLAGCSTFSNVLPSPSFSFVHKIDIQQGAVITQEMVAQLRPGMTREQVRFVLGTPPLTDVFHAERWDYVYSMQRRGGPIERRNFTVQFDDGRLKSFGGDPVPSEKDFDQDASRNAAEPVQLPPRM